MLRSILVVLAMLSLAAGAARAENRVRVDSYAGVPHITLTGEFQGSHYTVYRSAKSDGAFTPITEYDVLCLASCFVDDRTALPGATYWYRFDVAPWNASPMSFGPYAVTIPAAYPGRIHLRVFPNPAAEISRIELYQLGAADDPALPAQAMILDLAGRRVRSLWNGPLPRGITTLAWNGRDDAGNPAGIGAFFLRFRSPLGTEVRRIVRVR